MNRWVSLCLLAVLIAPFNLALSRQQTPLRILFMHHSTGENLIGQGQVRPAFTQLGYEFWDHGYNESGLTDAAGVNTGQNWAVPNDNTDPDGWVDIFNQPVVDPPTNTFSHMLEYDVILFKSCFPTSHIDSDELLEAYHQYYLSIRAVIDQHPDKLFIPFTPPPLVPDATDPESAARAQIWAAYLASEEFQAEHPNLLVFDFFSLLADDEGYLRQEYRPEDPTDSHPNELANQTIAPVLVDFVDRGIRHFFFDEPLETVEAAVVPKNPALLDDFEDLMFTDRWWTYADGGQFSCLISQPGYEGGQAMQVSLDLAGAIYAGCGRLLEVDATWAQSQGLSFYWRSATPALSMSVVVDMDGSPFEVELQTPTSDGWEPVRLTWDAFQQASWAEPNAPSTLDPTQIVAIDFTVGHWDLPQKGQIWIDQLELIMPD